MSSDPTSSPQPSTRGGARGVPGGELGDDDLLRELGQLHRTWHETLRHGHHDAVEAHRARSAELETEYLRRFPQREVDPRRLRPEGAGGLAPGRPGPSRGEPPEPMRASVPVDEPTASADWGTTAREQAAGEPLDGRLAREVPDISGEPWQEGAGPDAGAEEGRPAEEAAMRVERE